MKLKDALACSFEKWYPSFKRLTIESKLIKLDDDKFVAYLVGDGESTLRLPSGGKSKEEREYSSDEEDWNDEENEIAEEESPSFPIIEKQIAAAINSLGGEVFPKLNWSAPRDAAWISFDKTLRCQSVEDVLLLLKSSDFILRDVTQPFLHCDDSSKVDERVDDLYLVLRQWRRDIIPNSEFRCFVKSSAIVGICQRHDDAFFPFIATKSSQIQKDVETFYAEKIMGKFPLDDFVIDVHRNSNGEVLLLDFGPWGRVTDPLMFDWTELDNLPMIRTMRADDDVADPSFSPNSTQLQHLNLSISEPSNSSSTSLFRFVLSDADMRPTRFATSAVPLDFNHLATGEDPQKLFDFLNLQKLQVRAGSDDEEYDENDP